MERRLPDSGLSHSPDLLTRFTARPTVRQEKSMYRTIVSFVLALLGVALLAGGIWLAALGGSFFYILLGAAIIASAYLLFRRHSRD